MTLSEKILYHQIHPLKLVADISGSIVSTWLIWQHEFLLAMLGAFLPAVVGSLLVIRFADLERLRDSRMGRYIAGFMTRPIEAWRFGGQIVMWLGAWHHQIWWIPLGAAIVVAAWMSGLWIKALR
jgi:hypothetical protein